MNAALIAAALLGFAAGLRTMTALAAVSWASRAELIQLDTPWLSWLGYRFTPWIMSFLAAAEFITDQLPSTPSRKAPVQFAARILCGAIGGAAAATASAGPVAGVAAGVVGSIAGTLLGHSFRAKLAAAFGRDRPAALLEDLIAVCLAAVAISLV
jgi:uncharacterized membrane protein